MDFVVSVFQLINRRGYFVPAFNFGYGEKDTGAEWRISCGGTRAYMVRFSAPLDRNMDEQAADSHFMVRRVTASLLMSGFGLFQALPVGRVLFTDIWGDAVRLDRAVRSSGSRVDQDAGSRDRRPLWMD